jgi:hypothetical protein
MRLELPSERTILNRWDSSWAATSWRAAGLRCALTIILLLVATVSAAAQVSVTTYQYGNSRTGQNTNEAILTPSNVNSTQFGKLFSQAVDGQIYAQPLYIPNLTVNGSVHNVVFVATENDSVYAFDADSNAGANASPLWHASLINTAHGAAAGATVVTSGDVGCSDLQPIIGITGTPVIDPTTNTLYVEAKSKENGAFVHRLHAIDITTGAEKSPGPMVIDATVSGTGDGSVPGPNGNQLVFRQLALSHHSRPGLLLVNGTVYVAFASHCDNNPYHGWLFAYNASTFAQQAVFVTTPNGGLGGFWMSGAGIAADTSGNLFIATGNGTFDTTNTPATMFGDTILKLALSGSSLSVLDYFTPYNQDSLSHNDTDLGSGGVLLLPDQPGTHPHLLVQVGKEGTIYLVNRDQMTTNNTHYCSSGCTNDPEIVQELQSVLGTMWAMPAYWNGNVYFWGSGDVLKQYSLSNGQLSTTPTFMTRLSVPDFGVTPSISSNGTSNGILWAIRQAPNNNSAILLAFDATNVSNEFYDSTQAQNPPNRDVPGDYVKFTVPVITNGKVYIGTATEVDVFGLRSGISPPAATPQINPGSENFTGTLAVSITDSTTGAVIYYTTDGSNPVPGQGTTQQYSTSFNVTKTTTVNAIATATGFSNSSVASATYTLQAPAAPSITSASSTTFTVGTAGSFTVTTTGTPTPSLTETGALPSGVTFKDNGNGTGTLSGTPAAGTAGTYPLTIKAHNGVGTDASQAFTLTVGSGSGAPLGFVQANSATPQPSQSSVAVTYTQAQTGGNLNVVVVGWNDSTAAVSSVVDSKNNAYVLAVGPTVQSGTASQAIYYAKNIVGAAANGNTVTVTFSPQAASPDIRIAEYSGIDPTNPVDVVAAGQGSGTPSNSGLVTTKNARDLLVGANLVQQLTTGPGTGYTSRGITSPDGDILEDAVVTTTGSYSATAPVTGGAWIMQMVAFRAAGSGGTAPSITSASSTTFTVGTAGSFTVTATGAPTPSLTKSGALPSSVTFTDNGNGTATLSGTPAAGTAGTYPITITASNGVGTPASQSFTLTVNQAPSITSLSPTSGPVGTPVTITGTNFGSTGTVTFGGTITTTTSWSATSIATSVPTGVPTGALNVVVTVGGVASNGMTFTVTSGGGSPRIALVQHTSNDAGMTNSSTLAFNSNNSAGNWIGVCIRAGALNEVFTVTDSRGNTYHKAVQFNQNTDGLTFGIYYAENIGGGANTVMVSDTTSATLRVAILEYSGVATSGSLDVIAMGQGHSTSPSSSPSVNTTANGELLLGAVMTGNPEIFTGGSGYQIEESVPGEPGTKLMVEDQIQAIAGAATVGASLGAADDWAAGLAAFKPAAGGGGTAPSITSASSTTFTVGTAGSFTVTTTGSPTPSLTESGALPSSVTFTNNGNGTATLSGTPAAGTAGTYPLTIKAHNGVGTDASQAFTLTVGSGSGTPLGFVQVNYATPQGTQTPVTVTYTKAQTAGNLNVVVVGWNDSTAAVSSVVDSKNNAYVLAVGPTVQSGLATQAIYYAKNIVGAAANGNTVTVTFSTKAVSPDIRIAEYSGVDPTNPVDVVAAGQGSGTPSNSGSVTTKNARDMLVGANLVQQLTTGPGTGYTSRGITSPDGDILEDAVVTTTGSYSATAPVTGGAWIMQVVAFRAAN